MKQKSIIIALIMLTLGMNQATAQNTNTIYFMDEIAERNNLNPALTPNCKFYFDFIIFPNFYLSAGTNNIVFNDLIYKENGKSITFLNSEASRNQFFNKLKPTTTFNLNLNINILSFGFKVKKNYFTFDMGVQSDIAAYLPRDLFRFALYGTPDANGINSFNFSSLGVDGSIYSNINLGYMRTINKKWTIGLKAKFLMGYANISTNLQTMQLNASRQQWSLKTDGKITASLPVTFGTDENGNTDIRQIALQNQNQLISLLYKPAGYGAALDFGISYKPINSLTISASVTDLGFIYWNRNLISGSMKGEHSIAQLIDYNVGDTINSDQILNNLENLGDEILETIALDETTSSYTTSLRANFIVAVEYGILKNKISFGALNRLKFNTSRINNETSVAVNFRPLNWLKASFSYSFLNGRWGNIGAGLNIRSGMFNLYLIADYIPLSYSKLYSEDSKPLTIPNRTQLFNVQAGWSWNIGRFSNDPDDDGVKRRKDKCPNTDMDFLRKQCPGLKKKEYVDKFGCEYDQDQDGVHDCFDKCPNTPAGVSVDSEGCPIELNPNNEVTQE